MFSIDFVVKFLEFSGHDAVMTIVDSVSKRVYFVLMYIMVTAEEAARLFFYMSGNSTASQNMLSLTMDPNSWLHSLRNCTGY